MLTGLPMDDETDRRRPVAVMYENTKAALPHRGISSAGLCFEIPVEGAINRILGVFTEYNEVENIGPVRSARDYFIDYAQAVGAVFVHYGGSPQAYSAVKDRVIANLDGINSKVDSGMFFRDAERKARSGATHSVFAYGAKIDKLIDSFQYRKEVSEDRGTAFSFADSVVTPTGLSAATISVKYSDYITGTFKYDMQTGLYMRSQFGEPHVDELNGKQVAVTNVAVIFTPCTLIKGDSAGRIKVNTVGSGDGYLFTAGGGTKIKWSKADHAAPLVITDESGEEVKLNKGKTWVCVTPTSMEKSFKYE